MKPNHYCPSWLAFGLVNPLRRLVQKPELILEPYVREGMTALDLGCGPGFFTIPLARMVGPTGRVIAVDLQQQMLDIMARRAARAGVAERIKTVLCQLDHINTTAPVDFALAMWMVHEVRDREKFFAQVKTCLKPGARFLMVEPKLHVRPAAFDRSLAQAAAAGLAPVERPPVGLSRAVVLESRL